MSDKYNIYKMNMLVFSTCSTNSITKYGRKFYPSQSQT